MASNADSDYAAVLPIREAYFDMAVIEAVCYGLYVALFFVTASTIIARRQILLNSASIGLHIVVVLMFILASIHMATRWFIVKSAFVYNGDTPLTTAAYVSSPPFSVEVLEATVFTTNTFFSDSILASLEMLDYLGTRRKDRRYPDVVYILGYLSVAQQGRFLRHEALPRDAYVQFSAPYFILSLCTTLLCTLLILLRIVLMTRASLGKLRSYGAVIEMVVESAALYSATLIAFIALGSFSENDAYPQAILGPMTGIAPTLIVARVSLGLSRPDPSWNSKFSAAGVSSMRFRSQVSAQPSDTVVILSTMEAQRDEGNLKV
ncbi:hypothetical protein C8F01DRAFT_1247109 [Mycena amicta]|nr:hypothetical protein C8F01DRAFT_1247109 [Mycena amicta]